MTPGSGDVARFEAARPRLSAIAYRMLGSATDAEDVVQETFLRWQAADRERIEVPEAWLTTVLANICRNQLRSARARRETYVGQWLPEPLLTGDPMLGPTETAEQRESVRYAVLTLLERLRPTERVVYVLRAAFDYPHREIAAMLELSESACQQAFHRAKEHVAAGQPRLAVDTATAARVVEEFLRAAAGGDTDALLRLLAEDVVVTGDGGGQVPARGLVRGAVTVAKFLRGLFAPGAAKRALAGGSPALHLGAVNGEPAVIAVLDQRVLGVVHVQIGPDGISAIRNQVNPEKLTHASAWWPSPDAGEPLLRVF